MTEEIEQKDSIQLESESAAEELYVGAKAQLLSLAANMRLIIPGPDVAGLFLGAGLGILLTYGEEVTRKWLEKALEALDDPTPPAMH